MQKVSRIYYLYVYIKEIIKTHILEIFEILEMQKVSRIYYLYVSIQAFYFLLRFFFAKMLELLWFNCVMI